MAEGITLHRDGPVATIVLDRPATYNALAHADWVALDAAVGEVERDPGIGCVVVRGAGARAFSTGLDMSRFADERLTVAQARAYSEATGRATLRLRDLPMPTLAVIGGFCMGSGVDIACHCDIRIAADTASFRVSPKVVGLYLDKTFVAALTSVVGRARALEIVLEGRTYTAAEAKAIGLVNHVVPAAALDDEARALALRLAERYAAISSNRSTSTSP